MKKIITKVSLSKLNEKFTFLSEFFEALRKIENLEKFKIKGKNNILEISLYFQNDVKIKKIAFLNLDGKKFELFNILAEICKPKN